MLGKASVYASPPPPPQALRAVPHHRASSGWYCQGGLVFTAPMTSVLGLGEGQAAECIKGEQRPLWLLLNERLKLFSSARLSVGSALLLLFYDFSHHWPLLCSCLKGCCPKCTFPLNRTEVGKCCKLTKQIVAGLPFSSAIRKSTTILCEEQLASHDAPTQVHTIVCMSGQSAAV